MAFQIVKDNIVKLQVEAIVNAANSSLLGGGGVDGAIHYAAGPELFDECLTLGGCKTGEAKITKGYNLTAKYVIHTVGPVWQGGENNEAKLLKSCYENSLKLAKENGIKSIAFPLISTGVYGYPKKEAVEIATETITDFLMDYDMEAHLVIFDNETMKVLLDGFPDEGPPVPSYDANVKNFTKVRIEFQINKRFEAEDGSDVVLGWKEIINVDSEENQLIINKIVDSSENVLHLYSVSEGFGDILEKAKNCFKNLEWVDFVPLPVAGVSSYQLIAVDENGKEYRHSGVCNRSFIPEDEWVELMTAIVLLAEHYGRFVLFNKQMFMDAKKDGEIKYCGVSFDDMGKSYHYKTYDETIKIGDKVLVPFGISNTEKIGIVEDIGYFSVDKVPYPLAKTKIIIRKVE